MSRHRRQGGGVPTLGNVGLGMCAEVVHNHIDRLAHRYFFWTAHRLKSVAPVRISTLKPTPEGARRRTY